MTNASPELRTVLLVDDDPISLQIISILLQSEDYAVTEASSGEEAIKLLEEHSSTSALRRPYEVLLADMQMPGMDGAALASHVRHLPPPRPRVIGMSATKPARMPRHLDGFLLKPVDPAALHALLTSATAHRSGQSAKQSVLDEKVIDKLSAIMPPQALREIYTMYVTDTRQRISELENCARQGDMDGLRRCAHMLKGSAAMAGVSCIAGLASALEDGKIAPENHRNLFQSLRMACDDVEQALAYTAPENTQ